MAFTLAEVLITLGIIGVVAAMTLPTLINKFQSKAFETAFKKQYSILNNAIDFLQVDQSLRECYLIIASCPTEDRPTNGCYSSIDSDCANLKSGLIEKLKLKPVTNDVSYPTRAQVLSEGGITINSTVSYDGIVKGALAFMLPDGAIIMFSDVNSYAKTAVIVDVNGKQLPNKWGYDAFYLTLTLKNNKIRLTDEYASLANKGGRLPRTILLNQDKNSSQGWRW